MNSKDWISQQTVRNSNFRIEAVHIGLAQTYALNEFVFVPSFDVSKIITDPPNSREIWLRWLENENPLHRFPEGSPDYYEKMEDWWVEECKSHGQYCIDPLVLDRNFLLIEGHHRYAISLKNKITCAPCLVGQL